MSIDRTHIRPEDREERPTAGVQLTYAVLPVLFVALVAWIALGCPGVM